MRGSGLQLEGLADRHKRRRFAAVVHSVPGRSAGMCFAQVKPGSTRYVEWIERHTPATSDIVVTTVKTRVGRHSAQGVNWEAAGFASVVQVNDAVATDFHCQQNVVSIHPRTTSSEICSMPRS